ncbi:hypothetical protein [Maritimibacter fusiformis]|uniref:Uncharacterized protein n=1 Tax=Maritimibacter fusiformis TaxID=2603819 RepID=A0A5D0RLW0_9RHOB|nr:hypothetical protein [Maritimibacter fusiformis]TYB82502.1 hypothetical protein FVF75_07245 [Maritimibacter fusiformis]
MAYEDIRAAIDLITDQIARHPEDRARLHRQLCARLAEMRRQGLAVPADLADLAVQISCDNDDTDASDEAADLFDNMPV